MTIRGAFFGGLGRVASFPSLLVWLYLASLGLALPLAVVVRDAIRADLGASTVDQRLREGFDMEWYGEFEYAHPRGIASTFGPEVIGPLPVLVNLEQWLDGKVLRQHPAILAAGAGFLLVWAFFAGGILDRYANPTGEHTRARLFRTGGEYWFRYLRLLVISLLLYFFIFGWIVNPLHARMGDWTRDVLAERTVILLTALVYLLGGVLLVVVGAAADYAKIALVADQRRSAVLAMLRGFGFVLSRPGKTLGLYLLLAAVAGLAMLLYAWFAPGPGQSSAVTVLLAFLCGQLYLAARIAIKLWFLASQTTLYQAATPVAPPPQAS
jgi:hypothetical protein